MRGLFLILLILLVSCTQSVIEKPHFHPNRHIVTTEIKGRFVDIEQIANNLVSGGPPKDGIPALDNPSYVLASQANFLHDKDIVFGVNYKGNIIAFPQKIMYWHEIVNQNIDNESFSITYCPLTNSVIGYLNSSFGVSGELYNSNLVLYDRQTNSLWPQMIGVAVKGERKSKKLKPFPVRVTTWKKWKKQHSDTLVLSLDTGYDRDYNKNPYLGYDTLLRLWFPVAAKSDMFETKKVVTGTIIGNYALAIPKEEMKLAKTVSYDIGNRSVNIEYDDHLDVVRVKENNLEIHSFDSYWFAWYAYYPNTKVLSFD